jgi:hypothetical protein
LVDVDQMKCASCDAELKLNVTDPCPHCGSAARIRLVELNDSLRVHDGSTWLPVTASLVR